MTGAMATTCPGCGTTNQGGNAYCEVCGLDFETGAQPAPPPPPAPFEPIGPAGAAGVPRTEVVAEWVAIIEVDAAFFASNQAADHTGVLALPDVRARREVPMLGDDLLVGRRSESRGITPAIDLSVPPSDSGVSHRHATLSRRGAGWSVTDLGSTNGSWITGQPDALEPFVEEPLRDGESLLLGAWTRISVTRVASPARAADDRHLAGGPDPEPDADPGPAADPEPDADPGRGVP